METVYKEKTRTIVLNSISDKIKLWCFGDVHRFTRSCDEDRWKWFLKKAKDSHDDKTYYIGLGDYQNFASAKEQRVIHSAGLHSDTIEDFDDIVKKRNRLMAAEMSFMKPNLLGLVEGNHNWLFKDGRTSTEDMADRLATESIGWLCAMTLRFNFKYAKSNKYINIYLIACHGKAGGRTEGASVNQLRELGVLFPEAHVIVMGHDHKRLIQSTDCFLFQSDHTGGIKCKQHRQLLCRAGSFKKAYTPDTSGYEISRLLKPADLGVVQFEIGFHRDEKNGSDRIITDITGVI